MNHPARTEVIPNTELLTEIKVPISNRLALLGAALLAAYQIMVGIEGMQPLAVWSFTIAFGILLVTALLMIILGYELLQSSLLAVVGSLLPLSFAGGLIVQYAAPITVAYGIFAALALGLILLTRWLSPGWPATLALGSVHAVSGVIIFALPVALSLTGHTSPWFSLVGLGGALMGLEGLLLYFLKNGYPVLPQATILRSLPALMLLMTLLFVLGFAF